MGTVISCGLYLNRPRVQPKRKPTSGRKACDVPNATTGTSAKDLYRLIGYL